MPAFDYIAYNSTGKEIKGVISADSSRHARRLLKEQKMLPETVSEVKSNALKAQFKKTSSINHFDLSLLLRQQAILIQSGLPLEEALQMTSEQAETDKMARIVQSWRAEIIEGRSMSEAMQRAPFRVPESIVAGIGVGEESGHLHEVMLRMADELETSAENRKTISRAMIYPATLIATSIIVITVMMIWVVPKITVIFERSDRELPFITRVVINLSNFTQNYGVYILVLGIAAVFGVKQLLKNPRRRESWHKTLLKVPGFGHWILIGNTADWARSLGILLHNGVPALAALKISSSVINNLFMRRRFESVTEQMRKGSSLQKALIDTKAGSGFLIHMVGSGEASSELDTMLIRVAEYYTLRLSSAVDVFLKVINPVLIIIMGFIILSVVAAVMLPIMDMNNMI